MKKRCKICRKRVEDVSCRCAFPPVPTPEPEYPLVLRTAPWYAGLPGHLIQYKVHPETPEIDEDGVLHFFSTKHASIDPFIITSQPMTMLRSSVWREVRFSRGAPISHLYGALANESPTFPLDDYELSNYLVMGENGFFHLLWESWWSAVKWSHGDIT